MQLGTLTCSGRHCASSSASGFDEWTRPLVAMTSEERILGVTNEQLAGCRSSEMVMQKFLEFFEGVSDNAEL